MQYRQSTDLRSLSGLGAMGISVEGPHRSDLALKTNSLTDYVLEYKPHEPGIYLVNIKFGDDHITGRLDRLPRRRLVVLWCLTAGVDHRLVR